MVIERSRSAGPPAPPDAAPTRAAFHQASLLDLESIGLLLSGGSIIDWHRLAFHDYPQVERFLRVNELNPDSEEDLNRLEELRDEAVDYLERNFSYRIPPEVSTGVPVQELFLLASARGRRQMYACIVLKVMHVIHHLAGRELLFKLPVSDDEVFAFVEKKVVRVVEEIRGAGFPIVEFAWSRKERDSLLLKLLAKRDTIAASVYDKLRFRLITRTREDLGPVLLELCHRLIPFNYVIPGESVNGILDLGRLVEQVPGPGHPVELAPFTTPQPAGTGGNEFSGSTFRAINFVADMPVRISDHLVHVDPRTRQELGEIIFVLTEFQVMDAATAQVNETGENSHAAYKERQAQRVRARLVGPHRYRDRPNGSPGGHGAGDEESQG